MNYCYLVQSFPSNFARIHEMSLSILASLELSSICSIDSIRRLSDATSFFIRAIVLITERRTVAITGLTDVAIEMIDAKSILTQLRTPLCRIQFSFIGCGSRCSLVPIRSHIGGRFLQMNTGNANRRWVNTGFCRDNICCKY